MSDPHIAFVVAAYSVAAVVIAAMIGSVVTDYRRLSAHLDKPTVRWKPPATTARAGADERNPGEDPPSAALAGVSAACRIRRAHRAHVLPAQTRGDPSRLPSALIGQSAPPLTLAGLDGGAGLSDADLRQGHVSVINVFGSWCEPCHLEHPYLMALAADPALKAKGVAIFGVAQKDLPENVRRLLGAKGDPYAKVGLDPDGRAGIDWGVYGVPETFIVRGDGTIAYKVIGPMTAEASRARSSRRS